MPLDVFWSFSDYDVDCHFLLSRTRLDWFLLLDDSEAARTLEDVENFVFRIAYLLVKVFGYLSEIVHVHARFTHYLLLLILSKQKRYEMEINIENPQENLSSVLYERYGKCRLVIECFAISGLFHWLQRA